LVVPVSTVVKIGGSLVRHPESLRAVLDEVADAAAAHHLVIVPGGGPFADAVRGVDRALALTAEEAHWMAVLAMDQYAHLLAGRVRGGAVVHTVDGIEAALASGRIPVLAPYQWLREADPLPHSWDVTSDSIAAWAAGALGASCIVLVKAPHAEGTLLDRHFVRALPSGVTPVIVTADRIDALRSALDAGAPAR
jgi:aspartokinase-like uncharacterized kinase